MSSVPMNQQERTVWWGSCQLRAFDNPEESCTWESTPSLSYEYAEKARQEHKREHALRELDAPGRVAYKAFFTAWSEAYGGSGMESTWEELEEAQRGGWRAAASALRDYFRNAV